MVTEASFARLYEDKDENDLSAMLAMMSGQRFRFVLPLNLYISDKTSTIVEMDGPFANVALAGN